MIWEKEFETIPEGWKLLKSATAHPKGYRWITDGKSLFDPEHKVALLRIDDNNEKY